MRERTTIDFDIVNCDDFLELPQEAQVLYFHLLMRADNDGYVNNAKAILRATRCKKISLDLLEEKDYIQYTEDGCYFVTDWDIHTAQEVVVNG